MHANRSTAIQWFETMWSLPDFDLADRIIHPEYAPDWVHIPKKGPDQVKHEIRYFRGMFPDLRYEVLDTAVEGSKVWARYRGKGTHLGAGWGFEPTGRIAAFEGVDVFTFDASGLVVDRWAAYSFYDIFTELGLAPPWWELKKYLKGYPPGNETGDNRP